jgi:hypothetical protein
LPGTTNLGEDANHIALVSDVTFKAFTQHGPVSSYIAQKLSVSGWSNFGGGETSIVQQVSQVAIEIN